MAADFSQRNQTERHKYNLTFACGTVEARSKKICVNHFQICANLRQKTDFTHQALAA
jgi:hypothetical protein